MLYDGCHRDDIHIATGENRNDLLSLYIQMLERRHGQQAGILYNHFMILNHIEEGNNQFFIITVIMPSRFFWIYGKSWYPVSEPLYHLR